MTDDQDRELIETIKGMCPDQDEWRVLDYKDEFDTIWELGTKENPGFNNMIIVWSGMPERDSSGVNILEHLTPFDWMLSLSYQWLHDKQSLPRIRVFIVDNYSNKVRDAFSVKLLPAFCQAMPWMKVFSGKPADNQYVHTLSELETSIKSPGNKTLAEAGESCRDQIDAVATAWIGSVARSSGHHSINNILGPIVLGTEMGLPLDNIIPADQVRLSSALAEHVRRLDMGFKESVGGDVRQMLTELKNRIGDKTRNLIKQKIDDLKQVDFILIDDQPAWKGILNNILINDKRIQGFKHLLDFDEIDLDDPGDRRGFYKPLKDKKGLQVLIVDLRLHRDSKQEIQHFKNSINKAKMVVEKFEGDEVRFPWVDLGYSAKRFSELEMQLNSCNGDKSKYDTFRTGPAYLELLTLMIRTIAQMDPLIPIIVFSSTGQRHVLEGVRGYGNIITIVEKPRFFGQSANVATHAFLEAIGEALDEAFRLLTVRVALSSLHRVSDISTLEQRNSVQPTEQGYLEIYFDESGDDVTTKGHFSVGGIAILYAGDSEKGASSALSLHQSMGANKLRIKLPDQTDCESTVLRDYPLKWCGSGSVDKWLGCNCQRNSALCNEYRNRVNNHLFPNVKKTLRGDARVEKWFIFNLKSGAGFSEGIDLFDSNQLDNLNFSLIRWLLEGVIYEFFRAHFFEMTKLKIQIYGATRQRFRKGKGPFEGPEKYKLLTRFGIDLQDEGGSRYFYRSLAKDSMLQIVSSIHNSRTGEWKERIKMDGALCSTLSDNTCPDVNKKPFRHIHYLADVVPRVANTASSPKSRESFSRLVENKNQIMIDTAGEYFTLALDAGRSLDSKDLIGALWRAWLAAEKYIENYPVKINECSIVPIICNRVRRELSQYNGDMFMEFARGLPKWKGLQRGQSKVSKKRKVEHKKSAKKAPMKRAPIAAPALGRKAEAGEVIDMYVTMKLPTGGFWVNTSSRGRFGYCIDSDGDGPKLGDKIKVRIEEDKTPDDYPYVTWIKDD